MKGLDNLDTVVEYETEQNVWGEILTYTLLPFAYLLLVFGYLL